jgi:hypothetical protein
VGVVPLLPYLLPALGVLALVPAVWPLRRGWTPIARMSLLSGLCGALALALWRPEDGGLLDHLVHVAGLGRLLSICCMVTAISLQSAELLQGSHGWSPPRRTVALAIGLLLLLFYVASWIAVETTAAGPSLATLIYDRKRAEPLPEMVMNCLLGACLLYPCATVATLYVPIYRRARPGREQLSAFGSIVAWTSGAILGLLVVLQVLGNRLRLPAATLNDASLVHMAWGHLPSWVASVRSSDDDPAAHDRFLLDLISYVSDRLAAAYGHPAILRDVDARCRQENLTPYRHKVALEATRLITLINARVALAPHFDIAGPIEGLDDAPASDPRLRREQRDRHIAFLKDVYRVAVLADPSTLPPLVTPPYEPPGWRREVAALIADVLQAHGFVARPLVGVH